MNVQSRRRWPEFFAYYRTVLSCAYTLSKEHLFAEVLLVVAVAGVAWLILPAYAMVVGQEVALAERAPIILGAVAGVIVGLPIFLFNVLRAPVHIHQEQVTRAEAGSQELAELAATHDQERRRLISENSQTINRLMAEAERDAERAATIQSFNRLLAEGHSLLDDLQRDLAPGIVVVHLDEYRARVIAFCFAAHIVLPDASLDDLPQTMDDCLRAIPSDRDRIIQALRKGISCIEGTKIAFAAST